MTFFREVEQHCFIVTNWPSETSPLSVGKPADAVTISDLKKGDGRTFVVASRVEIFGHPPVDRSTVEKNCDNLLVA